MTIEHTSEFIFGGSILALLCVFASILSRRLGAPILLVFLILGMLAGEDGPGGIQFNDFNLAFLLGSLALAVIIFDGGLGARKETFRVSLTPALSLATVGVVITAGLTGVATHWIFNLGWFEAMLIGAIVGSTDAAAVFGLLRFAGLELKARTSATLEIESGTNDPMAIFLTVTLVEILESQQSNVGLSVLTALLQQMGLGLLVGAACGWLLAKVIHDLHLPASLYPLFTLAGGLSVFGLTNVLGGSGFLAIYIVGVIVGNSPLPHSNDIHRFHDGMAWLAQIGMFLMLGLLITPSHLPPIILPAIAISLVMIFIARPVAVMVSLLPFYFPWRDQLFISWCGLRGAVPIILALFPSLAGMEHTKTFFELVFFVVLVSLILQGWTIAPIARWLRVEIPSGPEEPEHLTVTLPSEQEQTLHIYDVVPDCQAVGMMTLRLPLSEGSQIVGVIRRGVVIKSTKSHELDVGDQVMLLASASTKDFGSLFSPKALHKPSNSMEFYGEFVINPQASLRDLSQVYGFALPAHHEDETVEQFINNKFHAKPVIGDRVTLETVELVVKETKADAIHSVGLKLMMTHKK